MVSVNGFSQYTSLPAFMASMAIFDVPVVGRGAGDRLDVLAIEHLAIIGVDLAPLAHEPGELFGVAPLHVGAGHHVGQADGLVADLGAAAPHADGGHGQPLRLGLVGPGVRARKEIGDRRAQGGNPGRLLQKIAAGRLASFHRQFPRWMTVTPSVDCNSPAGRLPESRFRPSPSAPSSNSK